MRKPGDIQDLIKRKKEHFGRIDILINNAGQGLRSSARLLISMTIADHGAQCVRRLEGMQAVIPIIDPKAVA